MALKRMDNVLIVVDDLEAAKAFFVELGLTLEGEQTVEGPLVGKLIGLKDVRATLAMMRTPDGQGIELDKFHVPEAVRIGPVAMPVNALGLRRVMFAVDDPYKGTLGQQGKSAFGREFCREFIETAPLSSEDKAKLAHVNAERLLLSRG